MEAKPVRMRKNRFIQVSDYSFKSTFLTIRNEKKKRWASKSRRGWPAGHVWAWSPCCTPHKLHRHHQWLQTWQLWLAHKEPAGQAPAWESVVSSMPPEGGRDRQTETVRQRERKTKRETKRNSETGRERQRERDRDRKRETKRKIERKREKVHLDI